MGDGWVHNCGSTTYAGAMAQQEAPRTRGRPPEFDRDEVVDRVAQLFWSRGYNGTGMNDIVEATGLNKSSIYNTFGSKDELFCEALRRYMSQIKMEMLAVAATGTSGLDDLHSVLDRQLEQLEDSVEARGCLLVNTGVELGQRNTAVTEEANAFRHAVRWAFRSALLRAVELDEVDSHRVEPAVEVLVGLYLATTVFERSGAGLEELRTYVSAQHDFVETLRTPPIQRHTTSG